MSFRPLRFRNGLALVVLAVAGTAVCTAQTQPRKHGRKLEESSSVYSTAVLTNLNQLGSQRDGLTHLEEALGSPLRPFSLENSLEGVTPPTYFPRTTPVVQRPRERDRRKELLSLATAELLMPGAPGEDLFGLSGGKNDELTRNMPLEQLYEQLNGHRPGETKSGAAKERERDPLRTRNADGVQNGRDEDDPTLPSGIRESEKNLKEMLKSSSGANALNLPSLGRGGFADFFGLGDTSLTPEQEAAHKAYMDKYKQLLGISPATAPAANPLSAFDALLHPSSYSGPAGLAGLPARSGFDTSPGAVSPFLNPAALPDLNAKVLNAWNPLYVPPKPEPSKPMPIAVPMSQVPRRAF